MTCCPLRPGTDVLFVEEPTKPVRRAKVLRDPAWHFERLQENDARSVTVIVEGSDGERRIPRSRLGAIPSVKHAQNVSTAIVEDKGCL